jgi:methanogenic corrinoid protein MtbC1
VSVADSDVRLFTEALLSVNRRAAQDVYARCCSKASPLEASERLIAPAMLEVGSAWEAGTASLLQVYAGARICAGVVEETPTEAPRRVDQPRMAVAVFGDGHGLGKTLVLLALRSSGYDALDFGSQQSAVDIAAACVKRDIEILFVSVLMLRSALGIADLKDSLIKAGSPAKLVVGGAPFRFDPALWREVGADHFGYSASDAIRITSEIRGGG